MAAGFSACDNGSEGTPPVTLTGGTGSGTGGSSTGTGGSASPGTGGTATGTGGSTPGDASGVPLNPMDGWIADTNDARIQGAVFAFGDDTSKMGWMPNIAGDKVCLAATAAKVDMNCTPVAPATDCYGTFWGVAIGMNLNQPIDMTLVPPAGGKEMPYDATKLKGFSFEISGNMIPGPNDFRFKVEDGTTEYCTPKMKKVVSGPNTVLFSDLMAACWKVETDGSNKKVTPDVQAHLIKASWQVVTNTTGTVPFDFCVTNIRALVADGVTLPPNPGTGSGTGGSGPAATGGSGPAATGGSGPAATGGSGPAAGGSSSGGTSSGGSSSGGSASAGKAGG